MTSMQRKQVRKAIHSWKGAGRLLEQWRVPSLPPIPFPRPPRARIQLRIFSNRLRSVLDLSRMVP